MPLNQITNPNQYYQHINGDIQDFDQFNASSTNPNSNLRFDFSGYNVIFFK